jgi:intracellular sulfur oxidation DsrE/DsrF family protein
MNSQNNISQEQLEAFVDGQLDAPDKERVLLALEQSEKLRTQVAELRRLKDLVRLAYDEVPEPLPKSIASPPIGGYAAAAAVGALAMLAVTQLIAWNWQGKSSPGEHTIATGPTDPAQTSLAAGDPELVMFHISTSDDRVGAELLDQVELVASQYRQWGRALRVVVVANNEGLRLYQVGHSQNERRIRELFARYDNITFAACGNTLQRLAGSGDRIQLLPQAMVVDSGVAEIARRQKQGWKYIRI